MSFNANDITNIATSAANAAIAQDKISRTATLQTSDSTLTTILIIAPADQSAGIIEVSCIGFDGTNSVAGIKRAAYKKTSDVVALSTVHDVMAVEAVSTETFSITASDSDIVIQVTGLAGTDYEWIVVYKIIDVQKEAAEL